MSQLTEAVVTILTAIVGVAILSVLVSRKSDTAGVIGAAGRAFGNSLGIATAPVTGSTVSGLAGLGSGGAGGSGNGFGLNLPTINLPALNFQ